MKKRIKPCLVGLLNGLLTLTLSVAVADEPVGPPEPVRIRMQANPQTANSAPSFAVGGKVTTAFGTGQSSAHSVVVQPDGKILVGGASTNGLALSRYLPNGHLDVTFGDAGQVNSRISSCSGSYSIALRSDGKIIASNSEGCGRVSVALYLPDGDLDTEFGSGGYLEHWIGFPFYSSSVFIQPDGKVLIAGYAYPNGYPGDFTLVRLLHTGSLDPTFGLGGYVTTDFGFHDLANSVLLQPDGKIVVSGQSNGGFAVARYLPNGVLDNTFGTSGLALAYTDSGNLGYGGYASARQTDGKILVAGSIRTTNSWGLDHSGIGVVRFLDDGTRDQAFGTEGLAAIKMNIAGFSNDEGRAIIQQTDGKIVVAGKFGADFAVVRLQADGSLDSDFGSGGKLATDFGPSDQAYGLTQQADGRLLAVGSSGNDFALARYEIDGTLDISFGKPVDSLAYPRNFTEQYSDRLGPLARILDAELAAAGTYDGATLTLRRKDGANAEDEFSATIGGSLTVLTPGSYFAIDSVTIGRVLTNNGGTLQLRFMGANATQARVDKALQQIAYRNASDRPPVQVLIDWAFDDGNTGAQGIGGPLSSTGTVTANISPENDWPQLTKSPPPQTAVANVAFSYTLPADTFNDPDGDPLTWNLSMADGTGVPPWLNFNPATRVLSGTPTEFDIGTLNLRVTVKEPANAMASTTFSLQVVPGVLMGLAAQGYVGTDNAVQFGAFTIQGDSRRVLIRGLGPALDGYVPGAIGNPKIALSINGAPAPLEVNDDWADADNADEILALKHQPKNATESAILRTLEPGVYNVHLSGSGGSTGIGMFQVYAVEGGGNGELKGLAAQGQVGTGNQVQFGAFTITGAPRKVLIRGLGPALNGYVPGPLENPQIALSVNGADTPIETNDDWGLAENAAEIAALNHQPKNPTESAILRTLEPGVYNVHLSGSGGTEGIGMFQVYTVE